MLLPYRSDGHLDYPRAVMPLAVREHAAQISARFAPYAGLWSMPEALALFHHVRELGYIADPIGIDAYVQEPEVTLRVGAGNCEAKALLACSMFRAVGIPSRLLRLSNGSIAHLLTQLWIGNYNLWDIPDDLAYYEAPRWLRRRYANVADFQYRELDTAGGQWVYADPVLSSFVGDIAGLLELGLLTWGEAGVTGTDACYFSDGSDQMLSIPQFGTSYFQIVS